MKVKTITGKVYETSWVDSVVNRYLKDGYNIVSCGCRDGYIYYFLQKYEDEDFGKLNIDDMKRFLEDTKIGVISDSSELII